MGFGGMIYVGTNGEAVVCSDDFSVSFARASDIAHPTLQDVTILASTVPIGHFEGNLFYFLCGDMICIWDVADPAHPVDKGSLGDCHYGATFSDFAVKNGYGLAADGSFLYILDPSNGGMVTIQNTYWAPKGLNYVERVLVAGDYAIVLDWSRGIGVYDVTDPRSPQDKGSTPFDLSFAPAVVSYEAPYLVLVYAMPTNPGDAFSGDTQVAVYSFPDVSDVSTLNHVPVNAQAPIILGGTWQATLQNGLLYCATETGVQMIDLSTPSAPAFRACFDDSSFHPNNKSYTVAVSGDVRLLADGAGLAAFDLNGSRTSYVIMGSELWGGFFYPKPVSLNKEGTLGLLNLDAEGVVVADFTSLVPTRVGLWENLTGGNKGYVNDSLIGPTGSYAYVATDDWSEGAAYRGSIEVLSLADRGHPVPVGSYGIAVSEGEWFPIDLTLYRDRYLLVIMALGTSNQCRVDILDLSSPISPALVGMYSPPTDTLIEGLATVEASGRSYMVLACGQEPNGNGRVQTVDITDLAHPTLSLDLDTGACGGAESVAIATSLGHPYAYVMATDSMLAMDISNPSNASATRVTCAVNHPYSSDFQDANVIQCSWGPLLAVGSSYGFGYIYDLSNTDCPRDLIGSIPNCMLSGSWASQAPGGSNSDLYVGFGTLGVGTAENLPFSPRPIVAGPFSPPGNTILTGPTTFTIQGVSDESGISQVQFSACPPDGWCPYDLGTVTRPTAPGTYSIDFDPTTIPESSIMVTVKVTNMVPNWTMSSAGPYTLAPEPPLEIQASASPSSGYSPLTVILSLTVTGGKPPYYYFWQSGDGDYGKGPPTSHTYTQLGTFQWSIEVEDSRRNNATAYGQVTVNSIYPPPVIGAIKKALKPFRLDISGDNFLEGCQVRINGVEVPHTEFLSATSLVAGEGDALKKMIPKYSVVPVTVWNPDGGVSPVFPFWR